MRPIACTPMAWADICVWVSLYAQGVRMSGPCGWILVSMCISYLASCKGLIAVLLTGLRGASQPHAYPTRGSHIGLSVHGPPQRGVIDVNPGVLLHTEGAGLGWLTGIPFGRGNEECGGVASHIKVHRVLQLTVLRGQGVEQVDMLRVPRHAR